MINKQDSENHVPEEQAQTKKPDESAGLMLESFFRITDPESGEVLVFGRS